MNQKVFFLATAFRGSLLVEDAVNPGDENPTVDWYMSFNLFLITRMSVKLC